MTCSASPQSLPAIKSHGAIVEEFKVHFRTAKADLAARGLVADKKVAWMHFLAAAIDRRELTAAAYAWGCPAFRA